MKTLEESAKETFYLAVKIIRRGDAIDRIIRIARIRCSITKSRVEWNGNVRKREGGREKRDNGMVTIVHLRSYIYALFCNAREVKYRCATRGCTMARSIAEWKATRYREGLETNTNNRTVYTCRRVYSYMLPMYNISTHTTTAELIRLGFISAVSEVGHFLVNSCDIVERGAANTE